MLRRAVLERAIPLDAPLPSTRELAAELGVARATVALAYERLQIEGAIESLCEDACEVCVTGDRTYASFNRAGFEALLHRVPSVNVWEQRAEVFQQVQDQRAIALDRVA